MGRPRQFCSQACRQWHWVGKQRAEELQLNESELIIAKEELDELHDELYVLACAVNDAEKDRATAGKSVTAKSASARPVCAVSAPKTARSPVLWAPPIIGVMSCKPGTAVPMRVGTPTPGCEYPLALNPGTRTDALALASTARRRPSAGGAGPPCALRRTHSVLHRWLRRAAASLIRRAVGARRDGLARGRRRRRPPPRFHSCASH